MPLNNIGSILGFAETIEKQNLQFFKCAEIFFSLNDLKKLFKLFGANSKKRITDIQRTRRENITEMILENISDFYRKEFVIDTEDTKDLTIDLTIKTTLLLIERSIQYYKTASQKLERQPEVSRVLKNLGKKHERDLKKLDKFKYLT
jgi:hypothetical protein